MRHWSGADFRRRLDVVEELQAQLSRTGPPSQNPFYGCALTVLIPTEQAGIAETLADARRSTRELRESAADLASALALSVPEAPPEIEKLCRSARFVIQAPRVESLQLRSEEWQTSQGDLEALICAGEDYREIRERYDEVLIPEAWDQDLLETRQHLSTHGRRWLRFMSGDYRRARDRLSGLCRGTPPEDVEQQLALVDAMLDARRNLEVIRSHGALAADLFGTQWQGERSDWAALRTLLDWVVDLHHKVGEGQLPEELVEFFAEGRAREGLESKAATVEGALVEQGSRTGEVSRRLE